MSEPLNSQKKKVVVLASALCIAAGTGGNVMHRHPEFGAFMLGLAGVALVVTVAEFVKLKREERA